MCYADRARCLLSFHHSGSKEEWGKGRGDRQNGIETAIASSATPDSRISIRVAPSHVHVISTRYSYVRARQKEVKAKERKNTSYRSSRIKSN